MTLRRRSGAQSSDRVQLRWWDVNGLVNRSLNDRFLQALLQGQSISDELYSHVCYNMSKFEEGHWEFGSNGISAIRWSS